MIKNGRKLNHQRNRTIAFISSGILTFVQTLYPVSVIPKVEQTQTYKLPSNKIKVQNATKSEVILEEINDKTDDSRYIEVICSSIAEQVVEYVEYIEEVHSEDIMYLAMCIEAEAGSQSELGKRLVCDVILNRYDDGQYSTYAEVINVDGQFSCVGNGSINMVEVQDSTLEIIYEEINCRTNCNVWYFRTKHYHKYGSPLIQEGDHYFSTY